MQREFEVLLPIGYRDEKSQMQRKAILRKMRGHEEDLLYDANLSAGQLVTALLQSCLVRLGNIEPVPAQILTQLYSADRNYLLLELRRITLGDQLRANYQCPACGKSTGLLEDLSQLEVRWLEDGQTLEDIALQLEDGYIDSSGAQHTKLILGFPRGVDEEFVSPMVKKDPLKARDALILRCIKRFGDLSKASLEAYGVKILRDLTLGDRSSLHRTLNDHSPGANFRRTICCEQCSGSFETVLDVSDFFALS